MKAKKFLAALTGFCIAGSMMLNMGAAAAVKCDCNADGAFDILDVINLTKYLHLRGTLPSPEQADVDGDGAVDVFDLALMLRALVGLETDNALVAKNLSDKVQGNLVDFVTIDEDFAYGQTQFALGLLRETMEEGKNVLVSPYSVEQALGMTANGAAGQTRTEMESVLGSPMEMLNPALYTLRVSKAMTRPPYWEEYAQLDTANSIWVAEGFPVSDAFLQTNADYYGADVFSTPMDGTTKNDVNCWVDEKTGHQIPQMLDEPPADGTVMLLVNAVTFDGLWSSSFQEDRIWEETFTRTDGTKQTVQMMHNNDIESGIAYIGDEHAEGFLKLYQGGQYAFAALLPEEGMTPEAYIESLTVSDYYGMISTAKYQIGNINIAMPMFSYDYDTKLKDMLADLGMPTAFTDGADFSGMTGSPNRVYISDVIHKTHIEVNATGTKAAAATLVEGVTDCATEPNERHDITLDRPFVYAIMDMDNYLPVFIGTVNSID